MSKGSAIVGFLLCFLGGMALMWGIDRSGAGHGSTEIGKAADAEGGDFDHSVAVVPVTSKDPSWGSANAPVTLVEYSDFQ